MSVYDTVNRLATELKESEEYVNYKMAKETLSLKPDLKKKIQEFEDARYDAQISAMQTGKSDEEKISGSYLYRYDTYLWFCFCNHSCGK